MYQEIMCNFENIYEAYRLAHRGKTNSPDVIEFDKHKLYNLNRILEYLQKKEWDKLFKYYRFKLYDPKERIVDAMVFEGRIVQHVLCDKILRPFFDKRLVKENCACRIGKGTDYANNLVKQGLTKVLRKHKDCYVLKMDVRKYFPSIDRSVLKNLISIFPDKEILELLYYIIDHCPEENGLPIGNQTSQWFALFYLNPIDRIIKEKYRIKYYARYMDDLTIILADRQLLNELRYVAKEKLHLLFNSKTQLIPLYKGFSFLGWRYKIMGKKIIKRIDNSKRKSRIETIRNIKTPEQYISVKQYLSRGNTWLFQKHYLQQRRLNYGYN
nr:MAG TPA: hypothetical protein [Caudoviricetes sp.]